MKEKLFWFTIALSLVIVLAQAQTTQSQRSAQPVQITQAPGRFQIYSLSHIVGAGDTTLNTTDIYRIDSETGKTWMFVDVLQNGTLIRHWKEIDEPRP
jgi:hypothetical protein